MQLNSKEKKNATLRLNACRARIKGCSVGMWVKGGLGDKCLNCRGQRGARLTSYKLEVELQ